MKGDRRIDKFIEDWQPRIGQEATKTLKSAGQYTRYFFILWPIVIAIIFAAIAPEDDARLARQPDVIGCGVVICCCFLVIRNLFDLGSALASTPGSTSANRHSSVIVVFSVMPCGTPRSSTTTWLKKGFPGEETMLPWPHQKPLRPACESTRADEPWEITSCPRSLHAGTFGVHAH